MANNRNVREETEVKAVTKRHWNSSWFMLYAAQYTGAKVIALYLYYRGREENWCSKDGCILYGNIQSISQYTKMF